MHESNDFDKLLMQYALNDKNYKKRLSSMMERYPMKDINQQSARSSTI